LQPLIVEAAINGTTPKRANPHAPRTVEEIVEDAGATIVQHHTDDSLVKARHQSAPYREAWERILARHAGALLYPTMGSGGPHTNACERSAHVEELADAGLLRLGLVDPGSVSLGPADGDGVPAVVDWVYWNSFADVRHLADRCRARGVGASVSIFEPGFQRVALAYHAAGRLPPAKIQLYFRGPALPFGLPPNQTGLDAYLSMREGSALPWRVGVLGADALDTLARAAIERGAHVRVGLEDYAGPRTPRNEELVRAVAALAKQLGRPFATPAQAAAIPGV